MPLQFHAAHQPQFAVQLKVYLIKLAHFSSHHLKSLLMIGYSNNVTIKGLPSNQIYKFRVKLISFENEESNYSAWSNELNLKISNYKKIL